MYIPRKIESNQAWSDEDGTKIYTISVSSYDVEHGPFLDRLKKVKKQRELKWEDVPSFAIFHDGASCLYLILAWWGNDNELFTSVSVLTQDGWVEDKEKFSFCLFDLEVFWAERNLFIEHIYCENPCLESYRNARYCA